MPTLSIGAAAQQPAEPPRRTCSLATRGARPTSGPGGAGVSQLLPWGGGNYDVSFNSARTTTTNPLTTFTPSLTSSLQAVFSQPLLREFQTDPARAQLELAERNRDDCGSAAAGDDRADDGGCRDRLLVLVSACASVDVQQRSLDLALELERTNRARVDVGQSPPLDLVAARAEVAQRRENLIVARTDALAGGGYAADDWSSIRSARTSGPRGSSRRTSCPPSGRRRTSTPRSRRALGERPDMAEARKQIPISETNITLSKNQTLPDLRLQATYLTNGARRHRGCFAPAGSRAPSSAREDTSFGTRARPGVHRQTSRRGRSA